MHSDDILRHEIAKKSDWATNSQVCNLPTSMGTGTLLISLSHLSTRIKDAGIAIRHSREYIVSILQGPEMGWRGWANVATHKKEVDLKKKTLFCYRKHIEDVEQDQKTVPDLLESIMRPTDPVKSYGRF